MARIPIAEGTRERPRDDGFEHASDVSPALLGRRVSLDPSDDAWERRRSWGAGIVLILIAALAGVDLAADLVQGTTRWHVVLEGAVVLAWAVGAMLVLRHLVHLVRRERQARADAAALEVRLAELAAEAARWRSEAQDLLCGLGAAIDRQLRRWDLSAAEREIALLLLKGLSHKQIAALRATSEATVRQQARSVYRKAGVEGRHDLAAFFLEGLPDLGSRAP